MAGGASAGFMQAFGNVAGGLVAAGTTQADALGLSSAINRVSTVSSGSGVRLPVCQPGDEILVYNGGANALLVYPPVGGKINALATNAAVTVGTGTEARFVHHAGITEWSMSSGEASGAAGTPGGSTTQVQFNDGGSFGGDPLFVYDKTNDIVKVKQWEIWDGTNQLFDARSTNKFNIYIGYEAGLTCTTDPSTTGGLAGTANTAVGYQSLKVQTNTAKYNSAFGTHAGAGLTDGTSNTFLGANGGITITTGASNVAVGHDALGNCGSAVSSSVAIGRMAMENATADNTVAIGWSALKSVTGGFNVAVGYNSGSALTTGQFNLLFGLAAGSALVDGSENIVFGVYGTTTSASASHEFVAGSQYTRIDNVYFGNGPLWTSPAAVTINGTGGSGTDIAGGNLRIAGGKGTGAGAPGKVILQAPAIGTTGSTLQSLVDVLTVTGDKTVGLAALTVSTLPAAGTAGRYAYVTDGAGSLAWGATVTGGGSTKYLVWDNGTNWTVAGK